MLTFLLVIGMVLMVALAGYLIYKGKYRWAMVAVAAAVPLLVGSIAAAHLPAQTGGGASGPNQPPLPPALTEADLQDYLKLQGTQIEVVKKFTAHVHGGENPSASFVGTSIPNARLEKFVWTNSPGPEKVFVVNTAPWSKPMSEVELLAVPDQRDVPTNVRVVHSPETYAEFFAVGANYLRIQCLGSATRLVGVSYGKCRSKEGNELVWQQWKMPLNSNAPVRLTVPNDDRWEAIWAVVDLGPSSLLLIDDTSGTMRTPYYHQVGSGPRVAQKESLTLLKEEVGERSMTISFGSQAPATVAEDAFIFIGISAKKN